jgi:hypothetical protein
VLSKTAVRVYSPVECAVCQSMTAHCKNGSVPRWQTHDKETIMNWLNEAVGNVCDVGIIRSVHCLGKCLNCNGEQVNVRIFVPPPPK